MTAIVIPRIFGGLGNQLFCYAAARRLALVNHAELVLDDASGHVKCLQKNKLHNKLKNHSTLCNTAVHWMQYCQVFDVYELL